MQVQLLELQQPLEAEELGKEMLWPQKDLGTRCSEARLHISPGVLWTRVIDGCACHMFL